MLCLVFKDRLLQNQSATATCACDNLLVAVFALTAENPVAGASDKANS
jgi:hypothetical protein